MRNRRRILPKWMTNGNVQGICKILDSKTKPTKLSHADIKEEKRCNEHVVKQTMKKDSDADNKPIVYVLSPFELEEIAREILSEVPP